MRNPASSSLATARRLATKRPQRHLNDKTGELQHLAPEPAGAIAGFGVLCGQISHRNIGAQNRHRPSSFPCSSLRRTVTGGTRTTASAACCTIVATCACWRCKCLVSPSMAAIVRFLSSRCSAVQRVAACSCASSAAISAPLPNPNRLGIAAVIPPEPNTLLCPIPGKYPAREVRASAAWAVKQGQAPDNPVRSCLWPMQ